MQNYNSKFKILVFLGILTLASFLRLNKLDVMPALNADEAAIGYNAYSLLETGKDEHGNPWPIHFQSFNDYKPGFYFYLVLPFIKVLGLNELSVKLPGALLGIGTILLVYLLVKELFPKGNNFKLFTFNFSFGEIAALFLTISPWHLHFSRGGWEVNAATFFVTLGVLGFVRGVRDNKWFLLSTVSFVASFYTYHAARIIVPLLIIGLIIIYRKNIFRRNYTPIRMGVSKTFLLAGLLGVVLLLPLFRDLTGPAGISRAAGVGLFADTGPFWRINKQRGEHEDFRSLPAVVLHNKLANYGLTFLENYVEHFWGEFLFLSGDEIQRNKVPEFGQMYLVSLPLLAYGLLQIARKPTGWGPIILWMLVAPLAAALTFQSPHALRAQNMVVPLVIVSAYGAVGIMVWVQNKFGGKKLFHCFIVSVFVTFVAWDFTRYLHQYYVHMNRTYDFSSQYGVKELVNYVVKNNSRNDKVVVTTRYDQPYILFLFYLKYPPQKFQQEHQLTPRDEFGFSTVESFDKFIFERLEVWDRVREKFPGALIAGTDQEIPEGANVVKRIYFLSGRTAFEVVKN